MSSHISFVATTPSSAGGTVHRQIELTAVTCVHDAHPGGHTPRGVGWGDAGQKACDLLDRLDRRGQTYALGPITSGFANRDHRDGQA